MGAYTCKRYHAPALCARPYAELTIEFALLASQRKRRARSSSGAIPVIVLHIVGDRDCIGPSLGCSEAALLTASPTVYRRIRIVWVIRIKPYGPSTQYAVAST